MTLRNSSGVLARGRVGGADAGVVDEDVDAPELLHRGVDERLAVLGLGDVGGDGDRLAPRLLDELLGLLELLHAPRPERDVGPRLGQRLGERHAEPRRRPRHDRHLVVQPEPVQHAHARSPVDAVGANHKLPPRGCRTRMGGAGRVVAGHRRVAGRAPAVADGARRRRARVRRGRADQRRQLRPGRGGLAARRPGHGRHRPGDRRAHLLRARPHRRPARVLVGRHRARARRLPRRHPGADGARDRPRHRRGRQRRAARRDLRLEPAGGDRLGDRHAQPRAAARR